MSAPLHLTASWGDLDLTSWPYGILMDPAPDWGQAEIEYIETGADLVDGSTVLSSRAGNRESTFSVAVSGHTAPEFEAACAALERQADRERSTLIVDEGRTGGTPWALDTYRAAAVPSFIPEYEGELLRVYEVTMPAAPWVRSVDPVVSPAITDGGDPPEYAETILYAYIMSSAGWAVPSGFGTRSETPMGIRVSSTAARPLRLVTPAKVWDHEWVSVALTDYRVAGEILANWGEGPTPPTGSYAGRRYWHMPTPPADGKVTFSASAPSRGGGFTISVLRTHNTPPGPSPRMLLRSISVQGSVRTPASLAITHPATALERVMAYTWPDDGGVYQPSCAQYMAPGSIVTPSSDGAWSGGTADVTVAQPADYLLPIEAVPSGLYRVFLRARTTGTTSRTITVKAWTRHGSTDHALGQVSVGAGFTGSALRIIDVGRLVLPTAAVPAESTAQVHLQVSTSGDIKVDDLLIFNVSTGSLSSLGVGTSKGVWIDSPTEDQPRPAVWVSSTGSRADARHLEQSAITEWGRHAFPAGRVNLFTACTGLNALASATYHARYRTTSERIT